MSQGWRAFAVERLRRFLRGTWKPFGRFEVVEEAKNP